MIEQIVMSRRMTINAAPAPLVLLEINEYGIKMTDKSRRVRTRVNSVYGIANNVHILVQKKKKPQTPSPKKTSVAKRLAALLSKVQACFHGGQMNN